MPAMTSRERVLTALRRQQPDRVPYCELAVDRSLAAQLMNWPQQPGELIDLDSRSYTVDELKALAAHLHLDNMCHVLRAPVYTNKVVGQDGRVFYGEGLIKTEADMEKIRLPNPHDDAYYAGAERFVKEKGDLAACFVTRLGAFPALLSMGIEAFSIALYENRRFVEAMLDLYFDWAGVVAEHACQMGFDVFISTDDHAFKSGPFLSPAVFHELIMPRYGRVAKKITIPWIVHSDGNLMPILDDLLSLGISGLHPNEKGAMDIRQMKRDYGRRICILGNVDLNILGLGTPAEVDAEVRGLIRDVGPGGGYIVTSGNSLASYCKPENARALGAAVQKYGKYPLGS